MTSDGQIRLKPDSTSELDAFVSTLREDALFPRGAVVTIAREPGRLDVMGGIADYSGSLVLQRPIAEATFAAVQRIERPVLEVVSIGRSPCAIPIKTLAPGGVPVDYERAKSLFGNTKGTKGSKSTKPIAPHWMSYVAGVFLVLARERGMALAGARVVV